MPAIIMVIIQQTMLIGIGMIGGSLIPVKSNRRYVALWARESKRVEYRAVTAR